MNCQKCKTPMNLYENNDGIVVRIDWLKCPQCNSKAEIIYDAQTNEIKHLSWRTYDYYKKS